MADRGGIQLLPENRKKIEVRIPGENRLLYAGVIFLVVAVGVYLGFNFYNQSLQVQVDELDAQLVQVEKSRDKKAEADLIALGKQANLMSELLDKHIFMTKAFANIESLMHGDLDLKSFSVSVAKQIVSFNAKAPSYASVARQIAAFSANDGIEDVNVGNIKALNTGSLEFGMEVKFKPEKFLK